MSSAIATHRLPSAIERKLRFVRWRHATLAMICTLAYSAALLITLMLIAMAIDWLFPFANSQLRYVMTGGTLSAVAIVLVWLGWNPVRQALRWNHAADAVDDGIPVLEERWSTVASLSSMDLAKLSPIQRAMAAQVTSEAVAMDKVVVPSLALSPVSLRPPLVFAACSALVLVVLLVAFPAQLSVLMQRFWAPSSVVTATQLSSQTGDRFVPRGESIDLVTELDGMRRSSALLSLIDGDGEETQIVLRPEEVATDRFVHRLRVDESLEYRIRSGDGQTEWHRLEVIDFPEIADVRFELEFPKYTQRENVVRDRIPKRIKVVQGSKLEVALRPVDPLKTLSFAVIHPDRKGDQSEGEETDEFELAVDPEGWYHFRMPLMEDTVLRPSLVSPHGLVNQRRLYSRIDVIADKAPVARIVTPTEEMAVSFDETIEIEFEAHDDHGVATAELVVYDESDRDAEGNPRVVETRQIPLGDQQNQKHVMGKTQLDLTSFEFPPGSQISYAVRVTDNRDVQVGDESERPASTSFDSKQVAQNRDPSDESSRSSSSPGSTSRDSSSRESDAMLADRGQVGDTTDSVAESQMNDRDSAEIDGDATGSAEMASTDQEPRSQDVASNGDQNSAPVSKPGDESTIAVATDASTNSDSVSGNPDRDDDPRVASSDGENPVDRPKDLANADRTDSDTGESLAGSDGKRENKMAQEFDTASEGDAKPKDVADSDTNVNSQGEMKPGDEVERSDRPTRVATTEESSSKAAESTSTDDAVAQVTPADRKSANNANATGDSRNNRNNMVAGQTSTGKNQPSRTTENKNQESSTASPSAKPVRLVSQQSREGQNTMTNRRRLKITEKLVAVSQAEDRRGEDRSIRENVVEIEQMLAEVETGLRRLVDGMIADSDRTEQFRRLDGRLEKVEKYVADLREQTKDNQYAFVGLQMVDVTRTHVTPARDRIFAAVQRPSASDVESTAALQHVVRARESLAALLKRYDRVEQERKLKEQIEDAVKMYEVYVEKRRILMRETRQNKNPLERKMAVVEVDQDYLDRLAEVQTLRREMIEGFAEMLGDDPRLLSRYMELVKRRGRSLRDQLTEISERQYEATEESLSWLQIDETQRSELWSIIVELRLNSANDLAQDAAQLSERIEKQLPLSLKNDVGTSAAIIRQAKLVASRARTVNFDAERVATGEGEDSDAATLETHARGLLNECEVLFTLLDRLQFENDGDEAVTDYLEPRFLETRAVADQADSWTMLSESLAKKSYTGLVETEQHRLAVATQTLRVEMLGMESDLDGQFQRLVESDLPGEIKDMVRQLHRVMEAITFNQAAASFRASQGDLESMTAQQELALTRLEEAEELFDRIRRAVVQKLDEYDPPDPNIADLRDPTLDEFLARLEREPNITTQLGIPNRRSNLRVLSDMMLWQQNAQGGLGGSSDAAAARVKEAMKMKRQRGKGENEQRQVARSEQEQQEQEEQQEQARRAQEKLEQTLVKIKAQQQSEETSDEQRERLAQLAEELEQMIDQARKEANASNDGDGERRLWQQIVESDQAIALVETIARGESLPDEQWNRLLSRLDDGLWQVRGKQPPEAYRKAIYEYQDQIRELMQTIGEQ